MTIWHNTKLKDDNTPLLPFSDRLRLGDAVFDTMLAVNGEPVHAAMHFDRLSDNAAALGISMPYNLKDMVRGAREILADSQMTDGRAVINTLVSRGEGERGLMPPSLDDPQIMMRAVRAPEDFPPVKAIIARFVRRNEGSPLSQIKSANYGDNILGLMEAKQAGANEAILLNNKGHVTCATSSNLFIVVRGRFYTPPLEDGVLAGVTRQILMDRIDVIERSFTEEEMLDAQAVFLTNSVRGFVPVTALEGRALPAYDAGIEQDFHLIA